MTVSRSVTGLVAAAAVVTLLCQGESLAQARNQVGISTPGVSTVRVGYGSATRQFRNSSYGAGSLARPTAATAQHSVLGSSIYGRSSYEVARRGGSAGPGSPVLAGAAQTSRRLYTPRTNIVGNVGSGGFAAAIASGGTSAAGAYVANLGAAGTGRLSGDDRAITSLAPAQPSQYQQYLLSGEQALRDGRFEDAYSHFRLANYIGDDDPESLLSLVHACFAKSVHGYSEAAHYLARSLRYRPELPLDPVRPAAFFGETPEGVGRYAAAVSALAEHVDQSPGDGQALLVLAYFRWYSGDAAAAASALAAASTTAYQADNAELAEAVNIFQDGIIAAGRSGLAAESPAPATQPAGAH